MKLLQCLYSSFYSLQLLANFARRRRTLSASTKKPASLAGFSYLRLCLTTLFLLPTLLPLPRELLSCPFKLQIALTPA
jgi:hypothetical protein